jgi:hypothetical protein
VGFDRRRDIVRKTLIAVATATFLSLTTHPFISGVRISHAQKAGKDDKKKKFDAKWLQGKWIFDLDYTTQKIAEPNRKKAESGKRPSLIEAGEMMGLMELADQLKGARVQVTDREVIFTIKGGAGKSEPYEISETPDADTVTLKQAASRMMTYHKEGDRFWMAGTGSARKGRFYFQRSK